MSEPFMSEIRLMSFNFAPKGWALANGQFLPINQNQALFSLLGTTYGGNGQTNFQLPNLQGRTPIHVGNGHTLGESSGATSVTITTSTMPTHVHTLVGASNAATTDTPDSPLLLANAALDMYHGPTNLTAMEPAMVGNVGGSQPHENMQPYLTMSYCIALQGIFPSQN